MHRALAIPEIVSIITQGTHQATLPSLAPMCRAFCDQALDLIWEEQHALLHLLQCMPDNLWGQPEESEENEVGTGEATCLIRPIVPADWGRFLFYSRRVKLFSFDVNCHIACCGSFFDILRISFPEAVLFPNLRTLVWWSGSDSGVIHHIRLLLAPRLRKLVIHNLESVFDLSLLPTLVTQCPGLTQVVIEMSDGLLRFLANLYTFVVSSNRLDSLSRVDNSVLEHLCRLPTLTSSNLHCQDALPGRRISSGGIMFPALRSLTITTCDTEVPTSFVPLLTDAPLQKVNIQLGMPEDKVTFVAWCKALGSHCTFAHNSLRSLSLSHQGSRRDVAAKSYAVQGLDIRPLFSFTEPRVVRLNPPFGFNLDDSTMDELARAWPRLEVLDLGGAKSSSSRTPSRLTLAALLSLAQHCPRLSCINLPLNASTQTPTPAPHHGARRIQQNCLTTLNVQFSPCVDVHGMAKILSSVFPALRIVHTDLDRRSLAGSVAVRTRNWKDVQQLLPLLSSVRVEEQKWTKCSANKG
ncbi:hypothetical protein FB45DRAFT_444281 [Roridomyces roridus]|uniref:F-box domain-containing protein n=1 Tax=Roridomyces roridus TaxID=1738132 RepID=A0AAD7C0Z8_9AGAR|nr:hypothetical protein FB45DRAFT_444281 [Roridomyces roridus]